MKVVPRWRAFAALLMGLCGALGCEKVSEMFGSAKKAANTGLEQATQAVENVTESVRQTAGTAGTMQLSFGGPIQTSGCYAKLFTFADDRPSVLQITSYNDPSAESFPSIIFRGATKAKRIEELGVKTLPVSGFLQAKADGPIWKSDQGSLSLDVVIGEGDELQGIVSGKLTNVQTGESKELSGTITAQMVSGD